MGKRRGGRGGRSGGGGDAPGRAEDQYGEVAVSQDRDEWQGGAFSRGGLTGGGSAGGPGRSGPNVTFERHVPRFLQPYAHMLGKKKKEDEPEVLKEEGSDRDQDDEQEALQRALEERPELVAQLGDDLANKLRAREEKELGNKAFAEKRYEAAVAHFSSCIHWDNTNEVYFSNRSAAYASLGDFERALADALRARELAPRWPKAHARVGAAAHGLRRYSEAREAYERCLELEPSDAAAERALDKAIVAEQQQIREHKHTFKKARTDAPRAAPPAPRAPATQRIKLSFAGDEEEEEEEG